MERAEVGSGWNCVKQIIMDTILSELRYKYINMWHHHSSSGRVSICANSVLVHETASIFAAGNVQSTPV